jgi:hypothetical protein
MIFKRNPTTAVICKSAVVALVMSLFFCISTDQMSIWPALYPKAALIAISCNLLLNNSVWLFSRLSPTRLVRHLKTKRNKPSLD